MTWWWSSSSSLPEASSSATTNPPPKVESTAAEAVPFSTTPTTPTAAKEKQPLSREEQATLEFNQFLAEFQAEAAKEAHVTAGERAQAARKATSSPELNSKLSSYLGQIASAFAQRSSPTHSASTTDTSSVTLVADRDASDVSFEAVADENLTCRAAFDYAFYCQSAGGQMMNVYRYGEYRECSHLWKEFWLCMRAKAYPEAERRKIIKQHNIGKLEKYKKGPSSEDVWEVRDRLDFDAPEMFKGDYGRLEREHREWRERAK